MLDRFLVQSRPSDFVLLIAFAGLSLAMISVFVP